MTEFIPGILFTWLAIWILFAFTTNLLYPLVRPVLMELHPATASTVLLSWITLPAFSALISCLLLFSPILTLILEDSACITGGCGLGVNTGALVGLPAVIIGFWLVLSGLLIFGRYWLPAHRLARQLYFTCEDQGRYSRVPSPTPAAFTLGWLRPRIFLTDGLLEQCEQHDIDCILNHEEAHGRRRDNLNQLLTRMFTAVLPSQLIKLQLDDYNLLCEQACDLEASTHQPSDQVAGTLLKVAKLQSSRLPRAAATFVGGHIEQRILAVMRLEHGRPSGLHSLLLILLALALVTLPPALFHWLILG